METMSLLVVLWAVLTTAFVILLIYSSALSRHEDDQLFLNDSESNLQKEQKEIMDRMNHVRPFVNILGVSSGLLVLLMAGLWVWRGWTKM